MVEGERYRLDRSKVGIDLDQLDQLLVNIEPDDEPKALEAARGLLVAKQTPIAKVFEVPHPNPESDTEDSSGPDVATV